jgi:hypothetical protein
MSISKIVFSRWSLVFSETPTLVLPLQGGGEEREDTGEKFLVFGLSFLVKDEERTGTNFF